MSRVAVILSGCGVKDGSEIHESVLCLLALAQAGHTYHCFAPDIPQACVVNHYTGKSSPDERRNVLVESARIARGVISPLSDLKADEYDAILLPGGFGAASNLSTFASEGIECTVNEEVRNILLEFYKAKRPIAATCITPAVLAKVFQGVTCLKLTLGEGESNQQLEAMGMQAIPADVSSVVVDEGNRIYTTPCYMNPPDLAGMFEGIKKMVAKL